MDIQEIPLNRKADVFAFIFQLRIIFNLPITYCISSVKLKMLYITIKWSTILANTLLTDKCKYMHPKHILSFFITHFIAIAYFSAYCQIKQNLI